MKKSLILGLLSLLVGLVPVFSSVDVSLALDQNQYLAGGPTKAYLKIGIKGTEDRARPRTSMNVAIVLDRSGSMEGDKIEQAKKAAKYAVGLLSTQDILSLVVYDTEVQVLIPATRLTDPELFYRAIDRIYAGESTALFAGVSKGAGEVRRFLDRNRVNRVILLSDGQANVGPDSPAALGDLGSSFRREGISVTTIGLGGGYNEDLMSRLAAASDGNHAFVENSRDLVRIFDSEFKDVLSVAALEVNIKIQCSPGVKPIRIMNRDGDIRGQDIILNLGQVLSAQEKYILVEVQLPPGKTGQSLDIAKASVAYQDLGTKRQENKTAQARVQFTASAQVAAASIRKEVKEGVVLQLATEANLEALKLKDAGKGAQAQAVLQENARDLKKAAEELASPALRSYAEKNEVQADSILEGDWERERKSMIESQHQNKTQQSY